MGSGPSCIALSSDELSEYVKFSAAEPLLIVLDTLTQLRKSPISRKTQEISTPIELPPTVALNQVLDKNWPRTYRQLTYNIGSASQAVQQAGSLVKILMHSLISEELAFDSIATFSESSSWLLDTLHDLRLIQRKWTSVSPDSPVLIIEMILKVFKAISKSKDAKWAFRSKAAAHLVFLCAEMTQGPEDLITLQTMRPEDQHILSMALLAISQVSIDNAGIARLAYSKLVRQLVDQCITITEQSDIWVRRADPSLFPFVLINDRELYRHSSKSPLVRPRSLSMK